jgi:hypothetical protein
MQQPTRAKPRLGPLLVLLGGVLVLVSGLTDWGKVSPPPQLAGSVTVKGSGIVLAVGAFLAILGVALWAVRSRGPHVALGVLALLAGLAATLITGVTVGSKDVLISTAATKYSEESHVSAERIKNALKALDKQGRLDVSVKIGLWLGLAGGVLVLVGGIAGIASARKRETPELGAPGTPFTGAPPDAPAGGPLAAPPPPPGPGPTTPEAGGSGGGVAPPLPPAEPPKPGEPGSTPG